MDPASYLSFRKIVINSAFKLMFTMINDQIQID